ncbi:MAG: OmpA family protein [Janthinobacterium lividum]
MAFIAGINRYLTDELLAQLAEASALPVAGARSIAASAVPMIVQALAVPVEADEQNARWDMCRQLYLSQLLTQPEELLRTDLGWPRRRRHLTQRLLGTSQVAALTEPLGYPDQAYTLLGYLTVIALAMVGEQADFAGFTPQGTSDWLMKQPVPDTLPTAVLAGLPQMPVAASKAKLISWSAVGGIVTASLVGGYFMLSRPADGVPPAPPVAVAASVAAVSTTQPPSAVVASAATPVVPAVVAPAPAEVAAVSKPAYAKAAAPVMTAPTGLRDTVGNAALARQVGGKFNVGAGRYPKGEGQPLIIKLVNRATLTVGINSTESLLYKRLVKPSLPRPADIAVDRLSFDLGQARLGAEGAQQLGNVASLLKTFPKARLVVVGHANNHEAQAMRLGLQRATLAVDELVKQGIAADRLQAQGMLSTELPGDSDSAEKQAMLQGITLKLSRL